MSNVKEKMTEVIQSQPDDATYEEIMRELAFDKMIERGLSDFRSGRTVDNEEMERLLPVGRRSTTMLNTCDGSRAAARSGSASKGLKHGNRV